MGRLHDKLKSIGYEGHALEVYLVRLVFLLFADDTNIWEKGIFFDYLDLQTKEDGSDLAAHLSQLFEVLNTPKEKRLKNLDESLAAFPCALSQTQTFNSLNQHNFSLSKNNLCKQDLLA